jgi:hypothetical protein
MAQAVTATFLVTDLVGLECPGNFVPAEELVEAGAGGTWEWRSGGAGK